jgi:hypothetical protein
MFSIEQKVVGQQRITVSTTHGRTRSGSVIHKRPMGSNEKVNEMKKFESLFKPTMLSMALVLAATLAGCGGGDDATGPTAAGVGTGAGGNGRGPSSVPLGSAGTFVILAKTAVSDVPTSVVTGDVGASPVTGAAIGVTCAEVTGAIYSVDAAGPLPCRVTDATRLTTAIGDMGTAYTNAAGRPADVTELGAGNIGGRNLGPAVYKWGTGVNIATNLTLTGGANDVWIFQIAQGLTVAPTVQIILAGGAQAKNVYWQTFAAADIGTTAKFNGIILSQTTITLKTNASLNGRMLAQTAVALDHNVVTQQQ